MHAKLAGLAAILLVPAAAAAAQPAAPAAPAAVDVVVLARAIPSGQVIEAEDLVPDTRPAGQARGTLSAPDIAGKEATRNLPQGALVRTTDVTTPRLVHRGEAVTIAVRSGALSITTGGRALTSGGAGDPVRVVSLATNRTLDAVVERAGTVRVVAP